MQYLTQGNPTHCYFQPQKAEPLSSTGLRSTDGIILLYFAAHVHNTYINFQVLWPISNIRVYRG